MLGSHVSIKSESGSRYGHTRVIVSGWIDTPGEDSQLKKPLKIWVRLRKFGLLSTTGGRRYGDIFVIETFGDCDVAFMESKTSTAPYGGPSQTWNRWRVEGTVEIHIPMQEPGPIDHYYRVIDGDDRVLVDELIHQTLAVKTELDEEEISGRLLDLESKMTEVLRTLEIG